MNALRTLHLALFFMRFFRSFGLAISSVQDTSEDESASSSLRIPFYTTTYQFSFKVLRQGSPSGQEQPTQEQAQDVPVQE